ncbi:hypothetical protein GOV07_01575, partial [Candidatus Woesearchaeota archaeon]|nr:hypothetical protein [Candidatus Woesearchaeota archaeon]
ELTINTITYKLEANPEDGNKFYIPAGSGVRDFMDEPEALLSPTFDIRYEGFKSIATSELLMDPLGDDEYELTTTNLRGDTFSWPVISNIDGIFRWGDDTDDFVFVEHSAGTEYDGTLAEIAAMIQANATATDFAISEDDYFLLSNDAKKEKAFSYILTYDKSNDGSDKTIVFSDESGGKYTAQYTPDATNALLLGYSDKLIVGGNTYKVWISADKAAGYPVAVDLNGDGKLTNNQRVNFTIYGGGVLDFALGYVATGSPALGAINGNGASIGTANDLSERVRMQLTTVETQFDDPNLGDETVAWNVSANVNEVDFAMGVSDITEPSYLFGTSEFDTITFLKEKGGDISRTYTSYGAYVSRDSPTDSPAVLLIDYPGEEVATQVFVVAGTTTRTESTEGITRDVVNPISVGLAVLDSDAGALGTANMIVVGGPCANTVAAEVMGNPTVCSEGFSPGKAMIKSVETGGKVAILVAGYEAQETQGASYVLANFGDYAAFQGEEVEVVVPDLSNIVVQAVTAAPVEEETPEE